MWVWHKRRPDHQTMAKCRRDQLQPLRQVCHACTRLGTQLHLVSGAWGAMDGSKGQAVQAQERHLTHSKLRRRLQPSDARMETSLTELEGGDPEEAHGAPGGARAEQLHAQLEQLKQGTLL